MSNEKVRALLSQLHEELNHTEVDAETLQLVRDLDADIHKLLEDGGVATAHHGVLEQAKQIEAKFAVEHPASEEFLREIVNLLSGMGV